MVIPPHDVLEVPLTTHEAFSGIFGSISVACWVFLLLPQLYENYKSGSSDSISLAFLFVWFLGDITNLAGALWAGLVPTVIATGVWFCFMDLVLLLQCFYYKFQNARKRTQANEDGLEERRASIESIENQETPLLSRRDSSASYNSLGLPGSQRRRSSVASTKQRRASLGQIPEEYSEYVSGPSKEVVKNFGSILFVLAVGAVAWSILWQAGWWKPVPPPELVEDEDPMPLGAAVLGYFSAVCYLGARLPQIYKNWQEKSCEGLSLLFFILSLMGNATYGTGVRLILSAVW